MSQKINLLGQRFGRLLVVADAGHNAYGKALWLCACDCGSDVVVLSGSLITGRQQSCRCLHRENLRTRATTHGHTIKDKWTPEYTAWTGMIQRASNPRTKTWEYYGGRGITVCEHWRHDFLRFLADVGQRPSLDHSLDKDTPGGDGHYHCPNCGGAVRWATKKEQTLRRRMDAHEIILKGWETRRRNT